MTSNPLDLLAGNVDRRQLLTRMLWGSVGAAATVAALPEDAEADGRRRVVFDVAVLGHTFSFILAPGATPPDNLRGSAVYGEGNLYARGTIPRGATDWDPESATPIGHWMLRGFFINRAGRPGEEDRPEPAGIAHVEHLIGRITPDNLFPRDQITTSGLANPVGRGLHSVVGGTGRYIGARGEMFFTNIGSNTTGFPNIVADFRLLDRAD